MLDNLFKSVSSQNTGPLEIKKDLVVLIIMDGFGVHPDKLGNSVLQAKTPFLDVLWTKGHSTLLHASGIHVGLPEYENGNSEVGHLNIGSGQVVYQSLPRINDAIKNGTFHENEEIRKAMALARDRKSKFHLMGILSDGGVHGHIQHLFSIMQICADNKIDPYIHVFLDGRDTGLNKGYGYVQQLQQRMEKLGIGHIASVSGRFYSMDRDKRWERTQLAYDSIRGFGDKVHTDPLKAIQEAYDNDENDQIMLPVTIVDNDGKPVGAIEDDDVALFYNFREDRARQLTKAFVVDNFPHIVKKEPLKNLHFVTMTGYEDGLPANVIFPPHRIEESLSKVLERHGKKQLHISETEKFMHVTYFFNGGIEEAHEGEDFFNIPSPKVFDYAEVPEMSAMIVRDEVVYRLTRNKDFDYSFVVINFANPDMLGHTGNLEKTIEANQVIDSMVKDVVITTLANRGCTIIIADHGNCETMINREDGSINTYHTNNPVPFILVDEISQTKYDPSDEILRIGSGRDVPVSGLLADIAPTVLSILDIEQPETMTGLNLLDVIA